MKCTRCNRPFSPPAAITRLVEATTRANRVPQRALKIVCPDCLKRPKEIASGKA